MKQHVQGVHHFALSVPDIAIARKFYIDLLGAEEISGTEWEPGNPWIDAIVGLDGSAARTFIARLKNVQVEIFEYTSPRAPDMDPARPVNHYGYTHVGFQVDDIQATYDKMIAAGLTFHTAPDMTTITVDENGHKLGFAATYGRDFFGNVFELLEIHENDMIKPV
ncbi:glyoxalase/bleomycin resistance/dioxygenase family protein [Croceicoccus ponticola]|uniref:Glyoxalase/bleomycin resistance/dioxygenase family protein n=1 Tax=Croceicoccus ponticola TaxID=2217664 RepID=A0A437GXK6_9SPHN|nr:VOC family protein [Croceicoccus ponticola]RVQ67145.1 glyoxalase/bleomycin resistance/dioxygenase family protein [Croceicoccus ponticola]